MGKETRKTRTEFSPTALVADDDAGIRHVLTKLLRNKGFRVTATGNLGASISKLTKSRFDLIILDMVMPENKGDTPDFDGGLVIAKLLQRVTLTSGNAVVVVFTAFPSVKDCFAVNKAGAFYLPKVVPGANMIEGLVEECTHLVFERRQRKSKPKQTWLMQHYDDLVKKFGGKTIAIVEADLAKGSKLKGGVVFGKRKIFTAGSLEELQTRILCDPKLRKAKPMIVDMIEE
ncbi:response regulator [Planctomycetota bacterium]